VDTKQNKTKQTGLKADEAAWAQLNKEIRVQYET
jgi:hypothetical protein